MKYQIEDKNVQDFNEIIDSLEKLLTERITELHEVKGAMQSRHVFVFYRTLLWEAKYEIRDSIKEIKDKK